MNRLVSGDKPVFNDAIGTPSSELNRLLDAIGQEPKSADLHYSAGIEYMRLGRIDDARDHLMRAVELDPNHCESRAELSQVMLQSGRVEEAVEQAQAACSLAPGRADLAVGLAAALDAPRQTSAAWQIVDRLLAEGDRSPAVVHQFVKLAHRTSRQGEALRLVLELLRREPALPDHQRVSLHFDAAQSLDQQGEFDGAFEHAAAANELRVANYDPVFSERITAEFMAFFTRSKLRQLPHAKPASPTPIFIVGLPRTGTSLVEQILASHPAVGAVGERDWIFRLWESIAQRYSNPSAPLLQSINHVTESDANELALQYLRKLQWASPGKSHVTDKTPGNLMHLGLISILFPNARVIFCHRDPLDVGVSCFMTDFSSGNQFSANLEWIGHSLRMGGFLEAHWKSQLDLPMLEVTYERMVADLESEARLMVEFVGLPWDPQCLKFFENARFVPTASHAQVRRPIYSSSAGRWRHYEKHLGPLKRELGI